MDGQAEAAVKDDHGAVGAVQFGDRGPALDVPGVSGDGHHVVDGDVLGEDVEEVAGPGQRVQALFDDAEERPSAAKSVRLAMGAFTVPASMPGRSWRRTRQS